MDLFFKKRSLCLRGKLVDLSTPLVMGILNYTPDSFYDGGRYNDIDSLVARLEQMTGEGADIIDVGAVSTRPGVDMISKDEEIRRLSGVMGIIRDKFPGAIVSVDTFRSEVAEIMVRDFGADMVNDISAGGMDGNMLSTVGRLQVPYIAMHMQGTPVTMQDNPVYDDVVNDILKYLAQRISLMRQTGIRDIIIDPGFGFGKTLEHNYTIAGHLEAFRILDLPLLAGFSRKSMIFRLLGTDPHQALSGTIALNAAALLKGADILRVHDVREAKETVKVIGSLK